MAQRTGPSYVGGQAIPGAVESISNLRAIVQNIYDSPAVLSTINSVEAPPVGYAKKYWITLTGVLDVALGTGTVTAGDPRLIVQNIEFSLQGATRIHAISGLLESIYNQLDNQVINNKTRFTVNAGTNTFYLEFVVQLTYSEANLISLIYKGGGSTYPTVDVSLGRVDDILTRTGTATASFTDLRLRVYESRIDAEAPRNPEEIVTGEPPNQQVTTIPGKGLWEETSQFIQTYELRRERISGPNQRIPVDLELGLPYLRLVMMSIRDNQIDSADTILSGYSLRLENTTTVMDFDLNLSDRFFREVYFKDRPGGVHVLTFKDLTASDRDILRTRELGRAELVLNTGPAAPTNNPATNYVVVSLQNLNPLEAAAMY